MTNFFRQGSMIIHGTFEIFFITKRKTAAFLYKNNSSTCISNKIVKQLVLERERKWKEMKDRSKGKGKKGWALYYRTLIYETVWKRGRGRFPVGSTKKYLIEPSLFAFPFFLSTSFFFLFLSLCKFTPLLRSPREPWPVLPFLLARAHLKNDF